MKVLVVGEYRDKPAEGMQVITHQLVKGLRERSHDVLTLEARELRGSFKTIKDFSPDVIHFTHGPSAKSIVAGFLLSLLIGGRWVVSATRPTFLSPFFMVILRPSAVFYAGASRFFYRLLRLAWVKVLRVAHGVDRQRFCKPNDGESNRLKESLLEWEGPVVLHVGHVRPNRGLEKVVTVAESMPDVLFVVIGSKAVGVDDKVLSALESRQNVRVVTGYCEKLMEYYWAADAYVFPVDNANRGAIDLPLSVLEALSCGLPVA